ncbi:VOC family protein [Halobacteriales archaeon Cl-PHB]
MPHPPDRLPAETTVGRVSYRVGDLDPVVDFYETVVGLSVRSSTTDEVVLGTETRPLLELQHAPTLPSRGPAETGLFHTAFRVPTQAALADVLVRLEDGWRLSGASDHLVSEALYCADPAENGVEVYCDRPQPDWPVADDGSVEMDTLPLPLNDLRRVASGADDVLPATDVGHVHLEVSSLLAAREFYADALGLNVRATYGSDAAFLAAGDYHHHVGLNVWNGRSEPAEGRGLAWFELVVPDEAALFGARDRLDLAGFDPTLDGGVLRVSDPDGIEVRLRVVG